MFKRFVVNLYKKWLYRKANVVGVGIGSKTKDGKIIDNDCLLVAVKKKKNIGALSKKDLIPKTLMGIKTDVIDVGNLEYMWRKEHRPVKISSSACWVGLTACSAGLPLYDANNTPYMLMNKHCAAPIGANVGDAIVQPSPLDGGTIKNRIGQITEYFFPEHHTRKDNIDYALVRLDAPMAHEDVVGNKYMPVLRDPQVLQKITKGSRTIQEVRTSSPIISTDFEATVRGKDGNIYTYPNCVLTLNTDENGKSIVEGGCSSSIGFIAGRPSVQTFAGSAVVGVFNKIQNSLDDIYMRFGLELFLEPQSEQKTYVALGKEWYVEAPVKTKTTVKLNLRNSPRVHSSTYIKTLPIGTELEIVDELGRIDGYQWCEVKVL